MKELTEEEVRKLYRRLREPIVTFGYTQDIRPHDAEERELEAVRQTRRIVLRFERERSQ